MDEFNKQQPTTQTPPPGPAASVGDVITTAALQSRSADPVDAAALLDEVVSLAEHLGRDPQSLLQRLVDAVLRLTGADSAGVSLEDVDNGEPVFRWVATAGAFARYAGGTMPRHFSPCGTVVDCNAPLLMTDPVRHFPYIDTLHAPVRELLLVPFQVNGRCVGTVWVVLHSTDRLFNATDLELVQKLSAVAGAGVQAVQAIDALQRAQREQAGQLLRSQEMATTLKGWFDHAPGFVALLRGPTHVFEMVNPAYDKLVGHRPLLGLRVEDALPEVDAQAFGALLDGVYSTGIPYVGHDVRLLLEHGPDVEVAEVFLDFVYQPVHDDTGAVSGILVHGHDVSVQHHAAQQLRDADRRKDEFVATLAHELRNPLAPIRQAVPIARSATATESQRLWSLDVIERQVNNMALLLDDLLDVSQVARGRVELRKQVVTVAALLEAAVEVARPGIDAKRHGLQVALPPADVCVLGDPLRLTQVFTNLLTNAAKYSEPGSDITVSAVVDGSSSAVVRVRDTGIGLPRDMLGRVFEMFTQLPAGEQHRQGGLGIGLALTKGLVELHGGQIEARSDGIGKGSEFTVRLPLTQALPAPALAALHTISARRPQRVLLADDNADALESLAMLLEFDGYSVHSASDGNAAWDMAQALQPDVCILDIDMPGLDGYEVARRVRQQPWGRRVTLVALTGWSDNRAATRIRAVGFDHHCAKPVDLDLLKSFLVPRAPAPVAAERLNPVDRESARLQELKRLVVLDTGPEKAYDDITRLAAHMCNTPIALISLVDGTRQWFKSRHGLDAPETARDISFCTLLVDDPSTVLVVNDTLQDPRFIDNPLVTGDPHIRFYAGAPLVTAAGHVLGSVCVIDREPRQLSEAQIETLQFLAHQVVSMLEKRSGNAD